jgi:hypothetical protein
LSPRPANLYAVLQVAPDAEPEVIDAAYRQLMRKYHPDLAGDNQDLAARLHKRAKEINQAYSVLRDETQRRTYDEMCQRSGQSASSAPSGSAWQEPPPRREPATQATVGGVSEAESAAPVWWQEDSPVDMLSAAFFLLPGPYEWERAGKRQRNFTFLLPPIGVLLWLAATGRLTGVIGRSPFPIITIALIGAIALLAVDWSSMPLLVLSGGATLLLATGLFNATLVSAAVPAWLAWLAVGGLSTLLAARLYVFGIMPTVAVCALLARLT